MDCKGREKEGGEHGAGRNAAEKHPDRRAAAGFAARITGDRGVRSAGGEVRPGARLPCFEGSAGGEEVEIIITDLDFNRLG